MRKISNKRKPTSHEEAILNDQPIKIIISCADIVITVINAHDRFHTTNNRNSSAEDGIVEEEVA